MRQLYPLHTGRNHPYAATKKGSSYHFTSLSLTSLHLSLISNYKKSRLKRIASWRAEWIKEDCRTFVQSNPHLPVKSVPKGYRQMVFARLLSLFKTQIVERMIDDEVESYERAIVTPSSYSNEGYGGQEWEFTSLDEAPSLIGMSKEAFDLMVASHSDIFRKIFWVAMDYYDRNTGVAITAFITVPMRTWMRSESYVKNDVLEVMEEAIQHGHERDEIDPELDSGQIRDLFYMYCYRQIQLWYYHGMKWKLVDTIPGFFKLFWKTVAPSHGTSR